MKFLTAIRNGKMMKNRHFWDTETGCLVEGYNNALTGWVQTPFFLAAALFRINPS